MCKGKTGGRNESVPMWMDTVAKARAELTEEQKSAIHQQLERILADPHFSRSRRFPSFLRYVVEMTLDRREDALKERTLGIEIFERNPDYDTAADPIVRVTAAEIRKRIAQYYQEPGREQEIRVSLPPGSYVPQFLWPAVEKPAPKLEIVTEAPVRAEIAAPGPQQAKIWRIATAACIALIVLVATGFAVWGSADDAGLKFFWQPILASPDPVLLCVADQRQIASVTLRDSSDPTRQVTSPDHITAVVLDDVTPIMKLGGVLQAHGKTYTLRGEGDSTLNELRSGPAIFVGAFDNAWTLRLLKPLRYHFANSSDMTRLEIVDSDSPGSAQWVVDRPLGRDPDNYRDYAIAARFADPATGKLAVVAAGIGKGGTTAAGEFLTDPTSLAELRAAGRAAGDKKNLEVVLSTQITEGEPGPPKVEAAYFW